MALSWQQGDTRDRTWPGPRAPCRAATAHARRTFFHDLIRNKVPPALPQHSPHSQGSAATPASHQHSRSAVGELLAGSSPCMDDEGQDTLI